MYLYELHAHTSQTSACSRIRGAELADFYKEAGYTGLVITDHFFNGSCAVRKHIPWAERVDRFMEGYRDAWTRGQEIGLDVFFGFEFGNATHFLIYGVDGRWLLDHPHCDQLDAKDFCELVHEDGGYVIQAHPARESIYGYGVYVMPHRVDGAEALNACNNDFENLMCRAYTEAYKLPQFCASDNHIGMRERVGAMELPFRAKSLHELIPALLRGEGKMHMYYPERVDGRFVMREGELYPEMDCPYGWDARFD